MFEKLLAALPYNPSLINQLSFYGSRLRREQVVRRAGVAFMVMAFFVQFFAVMNPPQPTVANSSNDIINNGFSSAAQAAQHCRANSHGDFRTIMAHYGISCDSLGSAATVSLKSTDHNRNLYSMGRLPYGKTGEQPINIKGKTYFMRYLWSWDSGAYSTYKALKVRASNGQTYYILYNCGNLTSIGLPRPVPPPAPPAATPPPPPPPCPYDSSIRVTDARCTVCPYDSTITKTNPKCVQCPNPRYPNVTQTNPMCKPVCPYDSSIDKDNPACKVCPYKGDILQSNPDCKPCDKAVSSADKLACLSFRKSAANPTQNIADAHNTKANAGDTIVYTLYVTNGGKSDFKDYVVTENMSDVLDYADIVNLHGGTMDQDKNVSWPGTTIKAGQEMTKTITVKVKDVIPQTPTSSSDPGHFDLLMTNVYGNTVNIELPASPGKTIEAAATTLPETGPGTSLAVAGIIMVTAGYFFARTRLLVVETKLAIQENANGGV